MTVVSAATGGHSTRSRCDAGIRSLALLPTRPIVRTALSFVDLAKDFGHGRGRRWLRPELVRKRQSGEPCLDHPKVQLAPPHEPGVAEHWHEAGGRVRQ